MSQQEYNALFDALDTRCLGQLTPQQIQEYFEALHGGFLDSRHVIASIRQIYRQENQKFVTKGKFAHVLQDLHRRVQVEEETAWDFQALTLGRSSRLPVTDVLLLFRKVQGDLFSMKLWHDFLASRISPAVDVSFDEVRMWLCDLPDDVPEQNSENELLSEQQRLDTMTHDQTIQDYNFYKKTKDNEARQKKDQQVALQRGASRKLALWEQEGLEMMLSDDGVTQGDSDTKRLRDTVHINDLLERLDIKYDLLRSKLFLKMLCPQKANMVISDLEEMEEFQQLQFEEEHMRKEGSLAESAKYLQGAEVAVQVKLAGLMGEVGEQLTTVHNQLNNRFAQLQSDANDPRTVEVTLQKEYEDMIKGPEKSTAVLVGLHERCEQERSDLLKRLLPGTSNTKLGQVNIDFCRLERQLILLRLEDEFETAATSAGLAERPQQTNQTGFDRDRYLQERLASDRLHRRKGRKLKLPGDTKKGLNVKNSSELYSLLVIEATYKHAQEREVLIQLLFGRDAPSAKAAANELSIPLLNHRLTNLRNNRLTWRNSSAEYRAMHNQDQMRILQEGAGLYYQKVRATVGGSEESVCSIVLADLQQQQDSEFEQLIMGLQGKKQDDLQKLVLSERESRTQEHFDTLARVVFGIVEVNEDEQDILTGLEAKYDALRHTLLLFALKAEHGHGWLRLSDHERQRYLVKKKNEEEKLRREGRFTEMARLIAKLPLDMNLHKLMGEDPAEFALRQSLITEQDTQDLKDHNSDVLSSKRNKSVNLLADLLQRFYSEHDSIVANIRSPKYKRQSAGHQFLPVVLLQTGTYICESDDDFERAALAVGLAERIEAAGKKRNQSDRQRQQSLSALRTDARKQRVENGLPHQRALDEYARPEKGDTGAWMAAFLREVIKKHAEERELLLSVLQDSGLEELVEVARSMPTDERNSRLAELRVKRNRMDMEDPGQREENISIIEEAAAIRCVFKRQQLEALKEEATQREITIQLCAELQDEQDEELANIISRLPDMSESALKKSREYEINARHWNSSENVVAVLTRHEGAADDSALLSALEEKYDALRDQLLLDALRQQLGEAEWKHLSEQERQKKLVQLRLREKQLRRDGKLDELAKLLGDHAVTEENLRRLMGDNRAAYDQKLQERLARRKNNQGGDSDDELEEDLDKTEPQSAGSALEDLRARYEAEKDELLRRMRGLNDKYLSERERQAELLRLKRDKRRAEMEDKFDSATRLIGLAERQQDQLSEKLKRDRMRQEQIAKDRLKDLMERRNRRSDPSSGEVLNQGSQAELQDAVMRHLDECHTHERELLVHLLLNVGADQDLLCIAKTTSHLDREDKLMELSKKRTNAVTDSMSDNQKILQEACVFKFECRRHIIGQERGGDIDDEDVRVSLLADLQEQQDKEAEALLNSVTEKNQEELVAMQQSIFEQTKSQQGNNIATVFFTNERGADQTLLAALDSKYDLLRDKVLTEALIEEIGEDKWSKMTEDERRKRLAELKLQEQNLRSQGNFEELAKLMGISKEEFERLENGEEEEGDEGKPKYGLLRDIMKNYDAEKEALLRRLKEAEDRAARERLRQLELVRLKREHRRARAEEKYDAAAIILGLMEKQKDSAEAERLRQQKLALERLAARRARGRCKTAEDQANEVVIVEDNQNVISIGDGVLRELELKHSAEREALLELLEDEKVCNSLRKEVGAMNNQQRLDHQEELRQRWILWRENADGDNTSQLDIFRQGAALRLENLADQLASDGKDTSSEQLTVCLLADLQQEQDKELNALTLSVTTTTDVTVLQMLKQQQESARRLYWHDNVASALLGSGPASDEEDGLSSQERELVDALQKKYDAAKDKLLIAALMQEVGEQEWASLSRHEQHKKLVSLRMEERRLRREGRHQEASALLGQMAAQQEALQKKLGDSRSKQEERLEERRRRRQELKTEREQLGLDTSDKMLEALLDVEMQEKEDSEPKDVLKSLADHFEDEKAALLAALRGQHDRHDAERLRQHELARLKREQKLLRREEKFDGAALLLASAKEDQKRLEENFASEKERQLALARERLAGYRRRRDEASNKEEEERRRLQEMDETLQSKLDQTKSSSMILQEELLREVAAKHTYEREELMNLLSDLKSNAEVSNAAMQLGSEAAPMELEQCRLEVVRLQKESKRLVVKLNEKLGEEEKESLKKTLDDNQQECRDALQFALAIRTEIEMKRLEGKDRTRDDIAEETSVAILADLQLKQVAETSAVEKLLLEADERTLQNVIEAQRQARSFNSFGNLNSSVFTLPSADTVRSEEGDLMAEENAMQTELDENLRKEKETYIEELRKKGGSELDIEAAVKELEAQQEAKRKALEASFRRQQAATKARLEARRRARDIAEYEQETAAALIHSAEREYSLIKDRRNKEKTRQQDLMAQRLAARREMRRNAQDTYVPSREASDMMSDSSSRTGTPSFPGGRLKREKTALDVEVSEDKKRELFSQVVRENADWKRKFSADQQRQQEQLQRRLANRSNKRQEEADALFSLGMRQKTMLEKTKQEERDRQITLMKERVARVRFERTMTMKDLGDKKAMKFDELVSDQTSSSMTEDEKMSLAAKRMQDKFKENESLAQSTGIAGEILEEDDDNKHSIDDGTKDKGSSRYQTREEKMELLKQRRLEKKRQRKADEMS